MYLIREVFHAKPGKAKELVQKFKAAKPYFEEMEGMSAMRIMTDASGPYWTVVIESELTDIGIFYSELRNTTASPELGEIMKGYMDLVTGGQREIYLLES